MQEKKRSEMSMRAMQMEIDAYISQFKTGYFGPLEQLARLSEEVGELAREVSHTYGKKPKKENETAGSIEEELADVLIVSIIMANSLNIDLTSAFRKNMDKFTDRDAFRFERKDGKTND